MGDGPVEERGGAVAAEKARTAAEEGAGEPAVRIVARQSGAAAEASPIFQPSPLEDKSPREPLDPSLVTLFKRHSALALLTPEMAADLMRWRYEPLESRGEAPPSYYDF